MSKLRIDFHKGGYYHITNRTASGLILFNDDQDYQAFDKRLEHYAKECNLTIIVKSLMPTHYHLLVRQDGEVTSSKFTQKLSISYFKFYTKRYNHHGAIFGQRFRAIEITDIFQMRNTCCYIHANAYKAALVDKPIDWQYGDLALFYSEDFWIKQTDEYLLESFGSLEGFTEAFEIYLSAMQLFQSPIIHKQKNNPEKQNKKARNKYQKEVNLNMVPQKLDRKINDLKVGEQFYKYESLFLKSGVKVLNNSKKMSSYRLVDSVAPVEKRNKNLNNCNPSSYG